MIRFYRLAILFFASAGLALDFDVIENDDDQLLEIQGLSNPTFYLDSSSNLSESSKNGGQSAKTSEMILKGVLLVPSKAAVSKTGAAISVEGFHSQGIEIPGGEEKINDDLADEFISRPLNKDALLLLKKAIVSYWKDQGYPLVAVQIPEQNIDSGILQVVVIESKLGSLNTSGNRWFLDSFYKNKFPSDQGKKIHTPSLMNDLAWLNRNPFQNAFAVFKPGKTRETTDVDVIVQDAFPLRFYAGADNTGNPTTENTRLFAGANWGYAFFLNQILSYQYSTAPNFKSFWAHTLNYTILFPWKNALTLYGGLSGVEPSFDDFGGKGRSYQASARYQIPLMPLYSTFSQEIAFGADFKRTNNNIVYVPEESLEVIGNQVNLFQFNLQYSLSKMWGKDSLSFMIEGFGSPGRWLPDESNQDYSELNYKAKNAYFYAKSSLSYLCYFPREFSCLVFLRGQGSTANLLPSEEMGIGGYDTVRGYEERILNVDNALIFNLEFRSPKFPLFLQKKNFQDELFFLAFFDFGMGNHVKSFEGQNPMQKIYSVGPGFRYRIQNYVSVRFDWGIQLKSDPFGGARNKFHFGAMVSY